MSGPLVFPLSEVKEKGFVAVEASAPAGEFPDAVADGALTAPISVKGVITQQDDEAVFEGSASGRWRLECTRCLTPTEGNFDAPVELSAPIDGEPMDLTEAVRESIVLAQPMKILCRPDCKGLCVVCRKNLNLADCGHKAPEPEISRRPRLTPRAKKR